MKSDLSTESGLAYYYYYSNILNTKKKSGTSLRDRTERLVLDRVCLGQGERMAENSRLKVFKRRDEP